MRHYATTAHAGYLRQLRVLHASMLRHCERFKLHVLAEGREVTAWADTRDDVDVTTVEEFLDQHPRLRPENLPGRRRTPNELACCWRWWFLYDHVMCRHGVAATAVDADLMFWSSPEPVFAEIGAARAAVLPHGFAAAAAGLPGPTIESHGRYGVFNGGFAYFALPEAALRMASLTLECSHAGDHIWPDLRITWGDQGALELVEEEFGAHVIRHPGAAPGPWNVHTRKLSVGRDGVLNFGDRPLVSFHYSSLRYDATGALSQLFDPPYALTVEQQRLLYDPYLAELAEAARR